VGIASHHPTLRTNETKQKKRKKEASSQFEITNKQKIKREIVA